MMTRHIPLCSLTVLLLAWCSSASAAEMPKRLPRSESFLGIHYDFHAGKDCTEIGKSTTREMIENILALRQNR